MQQSGLKQGLAVIAKKIVWMGDKQTLAFVWQPTNFIRKQS